MNLKLGSKFGKQNRRLFFLNKKRKIKIEENQKEEENKKEQEQKTKEDNYIITNKKINNETKKEPINDEIKIEIKKETTKIIKPIPKKVTTNEKRNIIKPKPKRINDELVSKENKPQELKQNPISLIDNNIKEIDNNENKNYLHKQIITVLEEELDENRFKLKKLDNEIYIINKEIDDINNKEEINNIEKEIEILIDKIRTIKHELENIKKTFKFDYTISNIDIDLIKLVEEYKTIQKYEKELNNTLEENNLYKTIINSINEIEEKQEEISEKVKDKKTQLNLDNEKIEKINNEIIDVEQIKNNIQNMIEIQNNLLQTIKIKVNETVIISEKIEYVTKTVNHSLFELFLLMNILRRNLNKKNNVLAAITAKIALDTIIKITTPTIEEKIIKTSNVTDYSYLINSCLNDVESLENLMNNNLNNISNIIYKFKNDYQECSYLPEYNETLNKLVLLEEEMKDRKKDITEIRNETKYQLNKNNEKVKMYKM